ncbi:MAG: anti-sigma factor domain-containing protein [Luteibaculaceae bacterium]
MEPKEFIESGILERFVLGECTSTEVQTVLQMKKQYPEVAKEIEIIEDQLFVLDSKLGVEPNKNAKQNLFNAIFGNEEIADNSASSTQVLEKKEETSEAKVISLKKRYSLLLAASYTGLALSLGINVYQYSTINQTQSLINVQYAQNELLQEEYNTVVNKLEESSVFISQLSEEIPLYRNPSTKLTKMQSTGLKESAEADLIWNNQLKKAFVNIASLPELPSDKQYQLWAIVEGKPVDMGVLNLTVEQLFGIEKLAEVPYVENAVAYAITIEPFGGNVNPTLDQMVVIGNV